MEEKKLTDEEIVKALECCIASPIGCDECPLIQGDEAHCSWILDVALDLIHRLQNDYSNLKERYVKVLGLNEKVIAEQKVEIERLSFYKTVFDKGLAVSLVNMQETIDNQKAEIERLTEQHLKLMDEHDEYGNLSVERLIEIEELKAKNAELQKQVDELKAYAEDIYKKAVDREEDAYSLGFDKGKEQNEKDTAKEILQELSDFVDFETFREGYELTKVKRKIKEMAKYKGVEVE